MGRFAISDKEHDFNVSITPVQEGILYVMRICTEKGDARRFWGIEAD